MDIVKIKSELRKLPNITLEALNIAWIEIVLERNNGNRTAACKDLNISICKIRTWIMEKGIKTMKPKVGHPEKKVYTNKPINVKGK